MGSSGSKVARTAAGSATRKYPVRAPASAPTFEPAGQNPRSSRLRSPHESSSHQANSTRSEAINLDARDPHLDASLRSIGPVQPNPTFSPSSISSAAQSSGSPYFPSSRNNPALMTLDARSRIQEAAEQEKIDAGRKGFAGRQFLDVATIRKILALRDEQGMQDDDVEKALRLKKGTVAKLGMQGIVEGA